MGKNIRRKTLIWHMVGEMDKKWQKWWNLPKLVSIILASLILVIV